MDTHDTLKSISELCAKRNFFIPSYQRGYRWTRQQVKDLLDDIYEFLKKPNKRKDEFYCIQPLIVQKRDVKNMNCKDWVVIDGQQRLTTIYILLSCLSRNKKLFTIEYETRKDSKSFLEKIAAPKTDEEKDANIDYYHMVRAKTEIVEWLSKKDKEWDKENKNNFIEILLNRVKFIWYESYEDDPIKVFTRLNIGKIALTDSELIKALFLNRSNFTYNDNKIRLTQQEIASEWDSIEYALQNDEFWLFLNNTGYSKPTRIDFLFDLMCNENSLKLTKDELNESGTDEHKTFRYFYIWFKTNKGKKDIAQQWKEVKKLYQIFQEWFNDLELYHYIGYLIENEVKISGIFDEWTKKDQTKDCFLQYIKRQIKEGTIKDCANLEKQYKTLTDCRPLLLLHNIQTIINQNKKLQKNEKYGLPVFYKFPFHLLKKEKWDVEHIDSDTENSLTEIEDQIEWLTATYNFVGSDKQQEIIIFFENLKINNKELQNKIDGVLIELKKDGGGTKNVKDVDVKNNISFNTLYSILIINPLNDSEKNKIWNFALLDSSTNRGYGNAIFPQKRKVIIGKDQGKKITIDKPLNEKIEDGVIAFIPPCTKNIFMKYYSIMPNNLREWDKDDAKAYLENIRTTLAEFLN
jgi:Uncharacterized conserved protein